jgi:glycogen synthase
MSEFNRITREVLPGRFIFLPKYSLELLKISTWGSDVWLVTPEPKREACSTSDQRAVINGIPVITTKTGGMAEYVQEFNFETVEGNGFFIEPYNPRALYEKLSLFSNLWYEWHDNNNSNPYSLLKLNAFNSGRALDIRLTLKKYKKQFIKLMK